MLYYYIVTTKSHEEYTGVVCGDEMDEAVSELVEFYRNYDVASVKVEDLDACVFPFNDSSSFQPISDADEDFFTLDEEYMAKYPAVGVYDD